MAQAVTGSSLLPSLLHVVVTFIGVSIGSVAKLAILAAIPSTSVIYVLVSPRAVPAGYVGEWAEPPRMFNAMAYATVEWVSFDFTAADQGGEVDPLGEVLAQLEPGGMEGDGAAFGVDIEAGGESPSTFFNIETCNRDGLEKGADGEGELDTVFFGGGVDKVLGKS